MKKWSEIRVPELNGVDEAPITEILVAVGDEVSVGDNLITVETEKATIEIAASCSGMVNKITAKVGDIVAEGDFLIRIDSNDDVKQVNVKITPGDQVEDLRTQIVVLGSGPGGYSAAFRAADLRKKVILVERYNNLGGVCLNAGCIPSKSLLHAAKVISETKEMHDIGLKYSSLEMDNEALRAWKNKVIYKLTNGLATLAKKRNVKILTGEGKFLSLHHLEVKTSDNKSISIEFDQAIIATGSEPVEIPDFPHEDPRVFTSTEALEVNSIPNRLLIVGGGIIGLEMATVYHELGSKVTVAEFADSLIPGADQDLVKPLYQRIENLYENIFVSSKVVSLEATLNGMFVTFDGPIVQKKDVFNQVLIAIGREPNSKYIGAEQVGIKVDDKGFITTDNQMRTNVANIFAVGDIVGQPMLAHKAAHEGKVAAEVIAGMDSHFDSSIIPSVAYTNPEIAWVGMTETRAKELNIRYEKGTFPWAASGRALSLERKEGITKTLYDPETKKIIGAGIVGVNAGDLISEAALAIKKGCTASEIGELVHPHPTLSETIGFSAEVYEKTIVDMYLN